MHFDNRKLRNQALDVIFEFERGGGGGGKLCVDIYSRTFRKCTDDFVEELLCKMLPSKFVMAMLLRRVDKASGRKKPLIACGHPEHENYEKTSCSEFVKEDK
ncbi:hypothetical protein MPH_01144 [Macrophomina phaseolina MS6]|uniref:Uncharacterized protein n=1 Tax=Macrophomina phaseolina (strain MS6) TaxID=1126212 RepID=K2SYC6_MACPH|nr:hypothetical protein MPH_01144 [Macrophomina phaseolina MS6]